MRSGQRSLLRMFPARRTILIVGWTFFVFTALGIYMSGYAVTAGAQVIKPDFEMANDYLIGCIWAIVLAMGIFAFPIPQHDKIPLVLTWLAKCWIALVFMLPYEAYYDLDCFGYYYRMILDRDLQIWSDFRKPSVGVLTIVGHWQTRLVESFHGVKVTFAMIGLIAIYLIYRAAVAVVRRENPAVLMAFTFVPSIVFWSSIIGKDPLSFLGVALYVYGTIKWWRTGHGPYMAVAAAGIILATVMRSWLGVILVLPLGYFFARTGRSPLRRLIFTIGGVAIFFAMLSRFAGGMDIESSDDLVKRTRSITRGFSSSRSGTNEVAASVRSVPMMVAVLPVGIATVLFRPLPGEINNPFGMLAGLENAILLFMFGSSVRALINDRELRRRMFSEPIFVWAILLIVAWCAAYGLVSIENLGASVRFRLPIITVFFGVLLWIRYVREEVQDARELQRGLLHQRRPEPQGPSVIGLNEA